MNENNFDLMEIPVPNSNGGTELMLRGLYSRIDRDLIKQFQIIPSRISVPLKENKIRILWIHDLPGDPMFDHLKDGGWQKFHKLVFVSNWQMQAFVGYYGLPWSHCVVMQNAIEPLEEKLNLSFNNFINIAYWSTPHRGLHLLVPTFEKICEKYDNIHLNIHSSFDLYGWGDRDKDYENIIENCQNNSRITYTKSLPNSELREKLKHYDILAYPSIWLETSCLVLMEAMSAGMLCVHPNYGALYETAANLTNMYQMEENMNKHAGVLYHVLSASIDAYKDERTQTRLSLQKKYADIFYSWDKRIIEWTALLTSLSFREPIIQPAEQQMFSYRVN